MAWLAATIINGSGWRKTAVKIEDLLPKKKDDGEPKSGGEMMQDYEDLKRHSRIRLVKKTG